MSARRLASALVLALILLPASFAQAGFAPSNETIFESEQTSAPDIAIDAAGNSIVAWSDEKALGDPREAKARRLSAGGMLGPVLELAPGEIGAEAAVATTAAGRAFIAWEARILESDPDSVKGRWVEPDGTMGPLLTLALGKPGTFSASYVRVVADPAGVATVSWQNSEIGGAIGVRRVQPDGTLGTLVDDISGSASPEHQTIALPSGSTVAIWRNSGIETNVIDASLGFGVPVKLSSTGAAQSPHIAVDSLGNALVAWTAVVGENWGVFGHYLGPAGTPSGAELTIDPLAPEFVNHVAVAADSATDFAVTWDRQNAKNEKTILTRAANLGGFTSAAQPVSEAPGMASPGAFPLLFDSGIGAVAWKSGPSFGPGANVLGRQINGTGLPTAPGQELIAKNQFNRISVASAAAIGAGAFLLHYPISGSAQGAVVRRFLAPPVCADAAAKVVQGKPIAVALPCTGAAIESAAVAAKPKHGTLGAIDPATLSVVYTPKPGFAGSDTFTYTGSNDGGSSGVARVTVSVGKDTGKPKIKKLKLLRKGKPGKQSFRLRLVFSEPATAKLTIKRVARVGGKLKPRKLGTLRSKKASRKATIAVKGKLVRRLRAGGRFRVVAVATDPARNRSAAKKLAFRVR